MNNFNPTKFNNVPNISVQYYEKYLPNAFDESLSILQKINLMIRQLNTIGEVSNNVVNEWNKLMTWILDEGLNTLVEQVFNDRLADGTFDKLIFDIVGDLSTLETTEKDTLVNAINEVFNILTNTIQQIGNVADLETTEKIVVHAINELKERIDDNSQFVISLGEATGYGVISGYQVVQQPSLSMAVDVGDGVTDNILHLPSGYRRTTPRVSLAIQPSSATLNRIDTVYADTTGQPIVITGISAINPSPPIHPSDGVLLAHVVVNAGDTTVNNSDIIDKRPIKASAGLLTDAKENMVHAINEIYQKFQALVVDVGADNTALIQALDALRDETALNFNNVSQLIQALDDKVGDLANLDTTDKTNVVAAINEIVTDVAAVHTMIGSNADLVGADNTTFVTFMNELQTRIATLRTELDLLDVELEAELLNIETELNNIKTSVTDTNARIDTLETDISNDLQDVNNIIGTLGDLTTTNTTNIVQAINELNAKEGGDPHLKDIIINVKTYGAVGNDSNDDTDAILQAVEAVHARGGGILYFPKGVYRISQGIVLHEFVKLVGENALTTFIKCNSDFTSQYDSIVTFRHATRAEHCNGISMLDIHLHANGVETNGVTGFSVYDAVFFTNVIVEGLVGSTHGFKLIPHEGLLSADVVSQTIIMQNCMAYANDNEHNRALYYFDSVQEMNIIGCKAFSGRDYPTTLRTKSTCFEFIDCRGVVCMGISITNLTQAELFPIVIRAVNRDSNGFVFLGTTIESCARILSVKGENGHIVDDIAFTGSRNEGSGGVNSEFYLENVNRANVEVVVGEAELLNVTNSSVMGVGKVQYQDSTYSIHDAGAQILGVSYPWSALHTSLGILLSDGVDRRFERVLLGGEDTGGEGYRALVVPN